MSARATMSDLITELRGMCDAGTADFTIAGTSAITYWSDAQLQTALDDHQGIVDFEPTTDFAQRDGSAYVWKIYNASYRYWEGTPTVFDNTGGTISGTLFSFDWRQGRITFTADQSGSARMVSGTIYDLNGAAADIWRKKADHYAAAYDVTTDNHNLSRSQLIAQAKERYQYYSARAGFAGAGGATGGNSIDIERGDM